MSIDKDVRKHDDGQGGTFEVDHGQLRQLQAEDSRRRREAADALVVQEAQRAQEVAQPAPQAEVLIGRILGRMTPQETEVVLAHLRGFVAGTDVNYGHMVAALAKPGADILASLTPAQCHLWHMASCIPSEAGELFDALKKHMVYGKAADEALRENVVEELGDIEFYLEGLRQGLGITREETLQANVRKLLTGEKARYKLGTYSNEQALARADKVAEPDPAHGRTFIGSGNEHKVKAQ